MAGRHAFALLLAAALCAQLCSAARKLQDDPTLYDARKMTKQQVADALAYQQLFTGYAALNPVKPLLSEVNCAPCYPLAVAKGLCRVLQKLYRCTTGLDAWCHCSRQIDKENAQAGPDRSA